MKKRNPIKGGHVQSALAWVTSVESGPVTAVKDGRACSCSATITTQRRAEARRLFSVLVSQKSRMQRARSGDKLPKEAQGDVVATGDSTVAAMAVSSGGGVVWASRAGALG